VKVVSLIEDPGVLIFLRGQMPAPIGAFGQVAKAGTTNLMFSGDDDPAATYLGVGNTQVRLTLNTGDPPNTDLIESVGPLNGTVTYTYTPRTLAAIPETPTWAAMLAGFASLAFAGYRSSRRAAALTVSKAH
jgi:hypothetical protein